MPDGDVDVTVGGDAASDVGIDSSFPSTSGTGRTPATDEGEGGGGDPDLEQVAEEFDAEALAALGGQRPRSVRGEGADVDGRRSTSDPIDDFIEKNYQGDRDAFVHSLYSSREEMKRMRSEIDELKHGEASHARAPIATRDREADFSSARASNPELQALDQEIKVIDNDAQVATKELHSTAGRAQQVASRVKELQGQMSKSEPEERAILRAEVAELNAELFSLDQDWKNVQSELRRLNMEKRRTQREVIRAEQSVRESVADEEKAGRERAEVITTTRQQFDSSLASHFNTIGVDPQSEQGQFLRETCRTKLRDYFSSLGDGYGLDGAGIHRAVGQILIRAVKAFGLRPSQSSRRSSITPRPIITPRMPAPFARTGPRPSSSQSSLDGVLDNPNLSPREKAAFVRKRADAVFAAGGRAVARGGRGPS
jgi:predicted  nucleic acid-binding Zn-ribbon protein